MPRQSALTVGVFVIVNLFAVGCTRGTSSPTILTSVPSVAPTISSAVLGNAMVSALSASSSTDVLTIPVVFGLTPGLVGAIEACVGEALTFVGDAVLVVHRTTLPDGSRLLVFHGNPQGAVALGTATGTTYRLAASDTLARVVAPSGTFVNTFTANLWVIGPGGAPRFGGPILVHFTVTPNGDVTADVEMFDKGFQCLQ